MTATEAPPDETVIHILWINAGLSCDGDSVALTAATQPSIEEIALGALPGLPKIAVHWPLIDFECGPVGGADDFLEWFFKADRGELEPFVLVVEGSIPNEAIKKEGYWCGFGNNPETDQPMTTSEWLDRLAPKALAVLAVGTCATYGGIHAMAGNPTGAMGVPDYLGWDWKSKAGLPIVCVPGCPIQGDNLSETILYLLYQATGQAPMIPLDDALRPTWLFGATVHEGCDRAGYYEQGDFATEYGSPKCIVKLGCWGPVVKCNVPKRGWINGVGGCPNVGGICIGCTMPGFPDKFMPFMDEPPGSKVSTAASGLYGSVIRGLRNITGKTARPGAEVAPEGQPAAHRAQGGLAIAPRSTCSGTQRSRRRTAMATKLQGDAKGVVEMAWDPITRIVGSLGIYTKIDFGKGEVTECHSTSSIFRGYSIFMKGKDPRDAHFITSRICGICGDNHATCSCYCQQMAYGVRPPHLGEWIVNLGEAAEYMFDHNIFQENLVGVDFCEKMVGETNPGVLEQANRTEAPHAGDHGYKTIGDIMRALNPFSGEFYREALQVSRYTRRDVLSHGGPPRPPVDALPGWRRDHRHDPAVHRLPDAPDALRRVHEAGRADARRPLRFHLRGHAGLRARRRAADPPELLGQLPEPRRLQLRLPRHDRLGRAMYVTPGIVVDGKLVTNDLVDINLGIRILLGHSFYDDWEDQEMFVTRDPLGNPVDRRHPWNQHTLPQPKKRDFDNQYSWVMSPRWFDGTDHLALDTGGGPIARLWSTALSGLVDIGYVKATGTSVQINLPKTALKPEVSFEWKIPQWSNTIERNRARTYFQAYAAACALHFAEKAFAEVRAGHTKTWESFTVPDDAIGCGFTEAVRGVLSHHMVIRDGKIANYHPYPPTPWNANPTDVYGTPGPYEDAVMGTQIFEENKLEDFKGIDIMRTVRSFDPCLPCGVHMYLGDGKVLDRVHSPTQIHDGADI